MKINFFKYQGTGNDFILIDNRNKKLSRKNILLFRHLCHRRFGVGADGVILLQHHRQYDFEMVYYNSDGRESSMCGNGGRCIVHFANYLGIIKSAAVFVAIDGRHEAEISKGGIVSLQMSDVNRVETGENYFLLNTGSPHYVKFVSRVSAVNIDEEGRKIRYGKRFAKQGVNVNFAEEKGNYLLVRTYERGVEGETLSCGTGVVASAICSYLKSKHKNQRASIAVKTPGGSLKVKFDFSGNHHFTHVRLIGDVKMVYRGVVEV